MQPRGVKVGRPRPGYSNFGFELLGHAIAAALLDGSAPEVDALDPVAPFGASTRIGAGWVITELDGCEVTWHNGGSGGFRSWLGLDRSANSGVAILSATSAPIDRQGFTLLAELRG